MGISSSSSNHRRRYNTYPPPPPPPPYYYPHDPHAPPPQPPQLQQPPTYLHHPPPPAPPPAPPGPAVQAYYNSVVPYNACNYANPMMNRFSYQHQNPGFYVNQPGGWPAVRAQVGPAVMTVPHVPYVEHQKAKKVRNDVNVHKDTLRVVVDEDNPDQYLVTFVFDALFDGSITIFYFAKEEANCQFVPTYPEIYTSVKIPFQKGVGQKFCQPSGTGIDLGFFELDDLSKPSAGEDVYPLVISAETCMTPNATDEHLDHPVSCVTSPHMQITQAVLEKINGGPFQVKVIRQILWIDEIRYELREIYGIGSSSDQGLKDKDQGEECVICMTEPKDTTVLPCRHMCMCSECAKELRLQSNKCPICRQPIEELIEIRINGSNQ